MAKSYDLDLPWSNKVVPLPQPIRYVPSTVVVGEYGEAVVMSGYIEIAGVRLYDE